MRCRIVEREWRQCRLLQLNSSLLVAVGGSFVIPEYGVHSAKVAALLCLNIANIQQRCEKCVHIVSQSVAERYFLGI